MSKPMGAPRYSLRVYLVRHGESSNNLLARRREPDYMNMRSEDPLLSEVGEAQARAVAPLLARMLAQDQVQATEAEPNAPLLHSFYCSPMWRAMQTTQPIAQALGWQPTVHMGIFEHGGIFLRQEDGSSRGYSGASRSRIQTAFPGYHLPSEIDEQGWWQGDEEDLAGCHARAIRLVHTLREETRAAHAAGRHLRTLMVTHGTFMDALVKAILGQLPTYAFYYYHNNTGITCIDFSETRTALHFLNRIDHLSHAEFVTY